MKTQFNVVRTFARGQVAIVTDSFLDGVRGFDGDSNEAWRELFMGCVSTFQGERIDENVNDANEFAREHNAPVRFLDCYEGADEYAWVVLFLENVEGMETFWYDNSLLEG